VAVASRISRILGALFIEELSFLDRSMGGYPEIKGRPGDHTFNNFRSQLELDSTRNIV